MAPIRKFDSKNDYYKLLEVDDFASVKDMGIPGRHAPWYLYPRIEVMASNSDNLGGAAYLLPFD